MSRQLVTIFGKEMKDALRDRRALSMLALFVIMYPAILWFTVHKLINDAAQPDKENIEIAAIGTARAPALVSHLEQHNIAVKAQADLDEAGIDALLHKRKYLAIIRIPASFSRDYETMRPAPIELWVDSAADQHAKENRLDRALNEYVMSVAQSRLLAHGVSPAVLNPIQLRRYDIAGSGSRSVNLVGILFGSFFAAAFFFGVNTAMDTTAGERERHSLELLMAQPVRPLDLIAGKWLAAAMLSIVGLTLELIAAHVVLKWLPLEDIGMSWRLSTPELLLVCVVSIPLCLFAAAAEIALAMNARSFKEAQTLMTFMMLLPLLPGIVVPMLNPVTANWMYLVPVLGNQTLLNELAKGQAIGIAPFALTAGSACIGALAAVMLATWRLKSERYVLGI